MLIDDPKEVDETTESPSDENETSAEDFSYEEESTEAPRKKSAEGRIKELLSEKKEQDEVIKTIREELEEVKQSVRKVPTPPTNGQAEDVTPEMQKAIDLLKAKGKFITEEDFKTEIRTISDRYALDGEHLRLESRLDGSDGRPRYDRKRVEDFMRDKYIGDPEIAYNELYRTELLDWELKKAEENAKKRPYSEKSGSSAGAEINRNAITKEKIAEAMKTPQGRAWYEKNREKILSMMMKGELY